MTLGRLSQTSRGQRDKEKPHITMYVFKRAADSTKRKWYFVLLVALCPAIHEVIES